MGKFVVRRLVISIPVLLGITILVFTLSNLIPGDPIDYLIPPEGGISAETIAQLEAQMGLDQPAPVRYVVWLKETLTGNLGYRYKNFDPVLWTIQMHLLPTLLLMGTAIVIGTVVGIPLGVLSAVRKYSCFDFLLTGTTFLGISLPAFFAGLLGLYFFSLKIPLFPSGGMMQTGASGFDVIDLLHHLILPATILSLNHIATLLRYTRSSMLEVMHRDYITNARAKGISEWAVVMRHALKNALLPVITVFGLALPGMVGGAVFVESIFSWPGMGTLFVDAVTSRDYPLIMGMTLIIAMVILAINILVDVAYGFVNPKIRYE